jgi:hypothetical protein
MQRTTAISRFQEGIQRGSNSAYSDVIHFARKGRGRRRTDKSFLESSLLNTTPMVR